MFENTEDLNNPMQPENKNIAWWNNPQPTPVEPNNMNGAVSEPSLNPEVSLNPDPSLNINSSWGGEPKAQIPNNNVPVNNPSVNNNIPTNNNFQPTSPNNEAPTSAFSLQKLQKVKEIENNINFTNEDKSSKQVKSKGRSYVFPVLYIFITLGILLVAWLISYDKYINLLLQPTITSAQRQYTIKYNDNLQKIKDYINPSSETINQIDLSSPSSYDDLSSYITNQDYSFIEKKDKINAAISAYSRSINIEKNTLDDAKQNIAKYGYIPVEVDNILWDDKKITTIENSLLSLETIKFASAINVFSYLDTFLNSLAKTLYMDKEDIQQEMRNITKDWEKNINLYIKKCYLNPFEYDYSCNVIGDFDRYYSIAKEEKTFNTKLFKQLIYYLDLKLEFTDIPSFNIMFQKFDANDDKITFSIDINTFKQDELELAKQWIINPHVFILTNLVNSLKQSKFIVWKDLKVDNLNVDEMIFRVWTTEFIVNNSKKVYTLPIQKYTQREIFDFVD